MTFTTLKSIKKQTKISVILKIKSKVKKTVITMERNARLDIVDDAHRLTLFWKRLCLVMIKMRKKIEKGFPSKHLLQNHKKT